jgi:hypothetical protein
VYVDIFNSETGYSDYRVIILHEAGDLLGPQNAGVGWGAREIPKND